VSQKENDLMLLQKKVVVV